jgi:hypothetical protein
MSKILETKVAAATIAGGAGGALATFILWALGVLVWHAPSVAGSADLATAAVPAPVTGVILTLLPAGLALLAGWLAPHTTRPDLTPVVTAPASPATALGLVGEHGPELVNLPLGAAVIPNQDPPAVPDV